MLAAIVDSSDDAIISKNLEGIIISWNRAAERIFGYTAQEAIGRPITILIPPDRLEEVPRLLARIRRGERIEHFETIRRRKDGQHIDVSLTVSPVKNARGKVIGASKIARDITEQKRAIERWRRSEERFRISLSSIGDAVMATDTRGHVTFMNSVAEKLTGWTLAEAKGLPLETPFSISNELSSQTMESPVAQLLREGTVVGLANHTILTARDGTRVPIDDSAAPIRDGAGELIGGVLVFRDITEQRKSDLNTSRLAAIIDSSDDAIIGKNLSGIILSWNKGAQRIFGYSATEMVGQSILRLIPPDRKNEEQQILERLLRGERVDHFETVRVAKDGRQIQVSVTISPVRNSHGEIVGASKIVRDVSDRTLAEQTRSRLAAIVESSDDAIISKSLDGIIQSWNKGAERMFGYTAVEVLGKPITLIIPPQRHSEEVDILARLRQGDRIEHYETIRVRKDGREVQISLTVSPIKDSAGRIIAVSKIVRDVTERKAVERSLREARERLQQQTQELEQRVQERTANLQEIVAELEAFSYSVSHDLRAPLRAMQQFSRILLDEYADRLDDQGKRFLERIVAAGNRMDVLIRDVLSYSKVLRAPLQFERIDLERLVNETVADFQALQPPQAEIKVEGPLHEVCGNVAFVTQCVSNLLTNAVKFVPPARKPRVRVWTELRDKRVRLCIEDNGIGIAPEHHTRIFGMFERLHAAKDYEGTGIGLAIVRKAVERMHGSVGLESAPGKGTTFWVELPAPQDGDGAQCAR